jgi:hypothetical protein
MDIAVTIPKNKIQSILQEEALVQKMLDGGQSVEYYWSISSIPNELCEGDRVFFVENGLIRSFHMFHGVTNKPTVFEVVDGKQVQKTYAGWALILDPVIYRLITPIPYPGFRGFRYVDFSERNNIECLSSDLKTVENVTEKEDAETDYIQHKKEIEEYLNYRRENGLSETMDGFSAWALARGKK